MLTPNQIRKKALWYWNSGKVVQAVVQGKAEEFFPLRIAWGKPTAKQLREDFAAVRRCIEELQYHSSPEHLGCTIEWQEINHRSLGSQRIPAAVLFDLAGFLHCTGREKAYTQFLGDLNLIRNREPGLAEWSAIHPMEIVRQGGDWPQLLAVIDWFIAHPRPGLYLRQLDITGVDSKFIERHKKILTLLLDAVLPGTAVNSSVTGLAHHGFERRYGLQYDEPLIRLRFLDPDLAPAPGCTDLTLPLSEFAALQANFSRVIITENKINGLCFPEISDAVIIFGLGYGVQSLTTVDWLQDKDVFYWGDIDTHGFSILSLVRSFLPQTRSFLMNQHTLQAHRHLWGHEEEAKRCRDKLQHLSLEEDLLYVNLRDNTFGKNIRLEQERLDFTFVRQTVDELFMV